MQLLSSPCPRRVTIRPSGVVHLRKRRRSPSSLSSSIISIVESREKRKVEEDRYYSPAYRLYSFRQLIRFVCSHSFLSSYDEIVPRCGSNRKPPIPRLEHGSLLDRVFTSEGRARIEIFARNSASSLAVVDNVRRCSHLKMNVNRRSVIAPSHSRNIFDIV